MTSIRGSQSLIQSGIPKTKSGLDRWTSEVDQNDIDFVFCVLLSKDDDERARYFDRWQKNVVDRLTVHILDQPESGVPTGISKHEFWESAFAAATSLSEGARILICGNDDISMVGAFTAAVLMIQGSSVNDAISEAESHAPGPIDESYRDFLSKGIPEPIEEVELDISGDDDEKENRSLTDALSSISDEDQEQFDEWLSAPDNHKRSAYTELIETRSCDVTLVEYGLRSVVDPSSKGWQMTSRAQKITAIRHLSDLIKPEQGRNETSRLASWATMVEFTILQTMYRYTPVTLDTSIVGAALLLQAVLDEDFALPISEPETKWAFERYRNLLDGRKIRSIEKKFDDSKTTRLGREQFDSLSAEGEQTPIDEKLNAIKSVIDAGIPLLDAIMVYRYRYRDRNRHYVLERLPMDLYGLLFYRVIHEK